MVRVTEGEVELLPLVGNESTLAVIATKNGNSIQVVSLYVARRETSGCGTRRGVWVCRGMVGNRIFNRACLSCGDTIFRHAN